eukprot:6211295-Pleurochrysis_carterae.AAC.1
MAGDEALVVNRPAHQNGRNETSSGAWRMKCAGAILGRHSHDRGRNQIPTQVTADEHSLKRSHVPTVAGARIIVPSRAWLTGPHGRRTLYIFSSAE